MKVKCIQNSGKYWFRPYQKISDMLTVGEVYEVEDGGRYPEYNRDFDHYLVPTRFGSKNFPASWFKKVRQAPQKSTRMSLPMMVALSPALGLGLC